ncbi:hypothetical protein P283_G21556 [Saccharomyces cerevisiae P283]|nr:hypothetical protein P283_G21556 [Saccharomyces cerevisiae P283]
MHILKHIKPFFLFCWRHFLRKEQKV